MHRNTFINSPKLLHPTYQYRGRENIFFAGQMTGVEGYVESAASGLIAGLNAARFALGQQTFVLPKESALGSMCHYITTADANHFQPMNANFGLFPPLQQSIRDKKQKNEAIANRALDHIRQFASTNYLASL
jgi:methylenetetrahydrofolate--tRNA-(uracil-5-)-methyltransferase